MIVVYAQGGGLGHLTRVRAALHTLGRTGPVTYLTSSPFAADHRIVGDAAVRHVPLDLARDPATLRVFVREQVQDLEPTEVIVDAFPSGVAGELDRSTVPAGVPVTHLARLLRWDAYAGIAGRPADPLRFDRTYLVEAIGADHRAMVMARSATTTTLALVDPPTAAAPHDDVPPGAWIVVHAGSLDETGQLVAFARDQAVAEEVDAIEERLIVITTNNHASRVAPVIAGAAVVDLYPAWPLFADAGRIYTAAGFNAMRQLEPHRARHRFVPFARRFDDQFERARRAHRARPG